EDVRRPSFAYGYNNAAALIQVLKQAGNDLSRENVMRQATNLRDVELPMLLPGIKVNTSPTDYWAVQQLQLTRFDGQRWVRFGELVYDECDARPSDPVGAHRRIAPPRTTDCARSAPARVPHLQGHGLCIPTKSKA